MTNNFESKFAPYIVGLIEQRRANGFKYESGEILLKRFDKFCITHFPLLDTVTFELAAEWASSSPGQSDGYRNNKISVVKSLSIFRYGLPHQRKNACFSRKIEEMLYVFIPRTASSRR